jgi:hypothetical protein
MRNITIFTTVGSRRDTLESDATIWSELQNDLDQADIQHDGLKAIVASTQNTLESSNATLPEGDFTLMLMPTKVKSGTDYNAINYNDLRRLASSRGITDLNHPPTKAELVSALSDNDDDIMDDSEEVEIEVSVSPSVELGTPASSVTINLDSELAAIDTAVASIRSKMSGTTGTNTSIAIEIDPEIAALEREANSILENMEDY